jgi:predicted metalloendopeptidase
MVIQSSNPKADPMNPSRSRMLAPAALMAALAIPAQAQGPLAHASAAVRADTACTACQDFYQFANTTWLQQTQIPAAYSSWSNFHEVFQRNQDVLRSIAEDAAAHRATAAPGSAEAKLGAFYGACMDSAAVEQQGVRPLLDELSRIDAIATPRQLQAEIARLHHVGVPAVFTFGAEQDDKDSRVMLGTVRQGGLGLPDRDYYLKDDSASRALRDKYVQHIDMTLRLVGTPATRAHADAMRVLELETALARASMTRVAQRDPNAIYHKLTLAEAQALAPGFDWTGYFREMGAQPGTHVMVRQPDFVRAAGGMLGSVPLASWKAYLRWQLANDASPRLGAAFVNESFHFQQALSGVREMLPRWKRCLTATDNGLGELLGQAYVAKTFTPEAKARAVTMVNNLRAALHDRLGTLSWMSEATRTQAIGKLDAFVQKIGYPDRWIDYSALALAPGRYQENTAAAKRFAIDRAMRKIGRPVDRGEWGMTPPTVNAYYNPGINEIVFPAGILQPPFFDPNADDATNYGGIGAVIGHEMTHGFDDEGRQYDAVGNLRDWWTPQDAAAYTTQAQRVVSQFNGYTAVDTLHLNGALTAGENIADLGGLTIAYAALQKSMEGKPRPPLVDGMTPEQRFFLSWAHIWRTVTRPEQSRMLVSVDPHSPGRWRVNGPLSNMPEFAAAFHCQAGDPMVRPDSVRAQIW